MKPLVVMQRELSLRRSFVIIMCTLVAFLAILYTSIYPSLHQASQLISSIGNVYKDVGIEGNVSFSTLQNFLTLEMFSVTWPILITIFAAGLSGAALAGEIEKGTLGMLLALPIRRTGIYLAKYLSGLLSIVLFVLATIIPTLLIATIGHMHYDFSHFATTALLCFLFGMTIYSLALLFSAVLNEKSHLYGLIGGIIFVMYVMNAVAGLKPAFGGVKYFTFFHYFDASKALVSNHIPFSSYIVFIAVSLLPTALGVAVIRKRDIII